MRSLIFKSLAGILLMLISPFIILSIIGFIYLLVLMAKGSSFHEGIQSFINIIYSFKPIFPYLTSIPIIVSLTTVIVKNKHKFKYK